MSRISTRRLLTLPALALILASLNCTFNFGPQDNTTGQTQTALASQQTALAIQNNNLNATTTAQQATIDAAAVQATTLAGQPAQPTPDFAATQLAGPSPAVGAVSLVGATPTISAPPEPLPPSPLPPVDLEARMQASSILVYEDIVTDPTEYQYVKRTLDAMRLNSKWDGNAIGTLKSDMLSGAPNGGPWDLVILAIETRDTVSGEYFDYLDDVLAKGTSVILEAWHLDDVSQGAISPILARCGVTVSPYFTDTGTVNDGLMWPLPGSDSPVLRDPNGGMSFTKARDKWLWSFDLGSKMALTGTGDAQMLLGTDAQDANQDGTLAVCMGGQLILQTFSSHTFSYEIMYPLWENYIYNALKVRLSGS